MAQRNSIIGQFRSLEVGESRDFPREKLSYIRASASLFGAEWDRKFSTHFDREQGVVTVTRTA